MNVREELWMTHSGTTCPVLPDCGVEVEYASGHIAVGRAAERDWSQVARYRIFSLSHPPVTSAAPGTGNSDCRPKTERWTSHDGSVASPFPEHCFVDVHYKPTSDFGRTVSYGIPARIVHWADVAEYRLSTTECATPWSPWTNEKPWALLTDPEREAMKTASDHFAYLSVTGKWAVMSRVPNWGADPTVTYRPCRILFGAP